MTDPTPHETHGAHETFVERVRQRRQEIADRMKQLAPDVRGFEQNLHRSRVGPQDRWAVGALRDAVDTLYDVTIKEVEPPNWVLEQTTAVDSVKWKLEDIRLRFGGRYAEKEARRLEDVLHEVETAVERAGDAQQVLSARMPQKVTRNILGLRGNTPLTESSDLQQALHAWLTSTDDGALRLDGLTRDHWSWYCDASKSLIFDQAETAAAYLRHQSLVDTSRADGPRLAESLRQAGIDTSKLPTLVKNALAEGEFYGGFGRYGDVRLSYDEVTSTDAGQRKGQASPKSPPSKLPPNMGALLSTMRVAERLLTIEPPLPTIVAPTPERPTPVMQRTSPMSAEPVTTIPAPTGNSETETPDASLSPDELDELEEASPPPPAPERLRRATRPDSAHGKGAELQVPQPPVDQSFPHNLDLTIRPE